MITVNGEQVNAEGMNISSYLEKNNHTLKKTTMTAEESLWKLIMR